jgi:hypothetical protein
MPWQAVENVPAGQVGVIETLVGKFILHTTRSIAHCHSGIQNCV